MLWKPSNNGGGGECPQIHPDRRRARLPYPLITLRAHGELSEKKKDKREIYRGGRQRSLCPTTTTNTEKKDDGSQEKGDDRSAGRATDEPGRDDGRRCQDCNLNALVPWCLRCWVMSFPRLSTFDFRLPTNDERTRQQPTTMAKQSVRLFSLGD